MKKIGIFADFPAIWLFIYWLTDFITFQFYDRENWHRNGANDFVTEQIEMSV